MPLVHAEAIAYPVLAISQDGSILVKEDASSLQTVNGLALRRQYFRDMLLIDSHSRTFRVKSVSDKKPATKMLGFRFMKPRLFTVKLVLEESETLPLQAIKDVVQKVLLQDTDLWDADGMLNDRLESIRLASDFVQVMNALPQ